PKGPTDLRDMKPNLRGTGQNAARGAAIDESRPDAQSFSLSKTWVSLLVCCIAFGRHSTPFRPSRDWHPRLMPARSCTPWATVTGPIDPTRADGENTREHAAGHLG